MRSLQVQDGGATARGQQTPGARGPAEPERAAQIDAKFSVADFVPSQPATTTLRHSEELARCRSRPAWVAGGETTEKCSGHPPFFLVPILKLHFISNLHFFSPEVRKNDKICLQTYWNLSFFFFLSKDGLIETT